MEKFQKFQFDNFVVGEDIHHAVSDKKEEIPTVEAEPVIEEKPLPPVPVIEEIKTYSEEELEEQVRIAEERGYENGFKTASEGIDAKNTRLWEDINTRLMMLAANSGERESEVERQMLEIVKTAIHKIVPALEAEKSAEIVNHFLSNNFARFKNEAKLAFYFNPETVGAVQENIARLANIHDFEGKISLHKDVSLGIADCRIEWENGGVERNSDKMLEKIDKTLEDASQKN